MTLQHPQPPQRARAGRAFRSGRGGLFARAERESNRRVNAASEWAALISGRGPTAAALQHSWLLELLTSLKELTDPKWSARHCPQPPVATISKGVRAHVCVPACAYVCA